MMEDTDINPALFDSSAETYAEEVSSAAMVSIDYVTRVKSDRLLKLIDTHVGPTKSVNVLDVGCGVGLIHNHLADEFSSLSGADVSEKSLLIARSKNPDVSYSYIDSNILPYANDTFDVAYTICVMHHVRPALWQHFVNEMARVTKLGGMIAVFEHNPYNPVTRAIVNRCEFDKDAVLLTNKKTEGLLNSSGLGNISTQFILTSPTDKFKLNVVDRWCSKLPLGAQYVTFGVLSR